MTTQLIIFCCDSSFPGAGRTQAATPLAALFRANTLAISQTGTPNILVSKHKQCRHTIPGWVVPAEIDDSADWEYLLCLHSDVNSAPQR
ncbi:MAG: hypothetical protein B6I36_08500 [Desulfobacteraceae bacterium 4572_35.1]|nr:MAG: hypothetical protein B6I36_08500 [Desulfobacteraceae bacterium 4572_35.1]